MTEEETKKENDSKEDSESTKILKRKISLILTQNSGVSKANTSFWLCHTLPNQVFIENPTPPPDPMA